MRNLHINPRPWTLPDPQPPTAGHGPLSPPVPGLPVPSSPSGVSAAEDLTAWEAMGRMWALINDKPVGTASTPRRR